jgi:orotidine-5'-phosphate decarboxylase
MSTRNFRALLDNRWARGKHLCVGLDSSIMEMLKRNIHTGHIDHPEEVIFNFNREIIKATADIAAVYKPNLAFYLQHGIYGLNALERTIFEIHVRAPEVPVILDGKFGDIGNTNDGYVEFAFNMLHADAVTVSPYLGGEALKPFLDRKDKGIFALCRTSNPGANEFQDLRVSGGVAEPSVYQIVARRVATDWNKNNNCGLVVGATYPDELTEVRRLTDLPILIPGVGAQGGDLEASVKAARHRFLINSSRGIIFAGKGENFAQTAGEEAQKLHNAITQALKGG